MLISTVKTVFVWIVFAIATTSALLLDAPGWAVALAAWSGGLITGALVRKIRDARQPAEPATSD